MSYGQVVNGYSAKGNGNGAVVDLDRQTGKVLSVSCTQGWTYGPARITISELQAIDTAAGIAKESADVANCSLRYAIGNEGFGSTQGIRFADSRESRLCYIVGFEKSVVLIDAGTGVCLGGSTFKSGGDDPKRGGFEEDALGGSDMIRKVCDLSGISIEGWTKRWKGPRPLSGRFIANNEAGEFIEANASGTQLTYWLANVSESQNPAVQIRSMEDAKRFFVANYAPLKRPTPVRFEAAEVRASDIGNRLVSSLGHSFIYVRAYSPSFAAYFLKSDGCLVFWGPVIIDKHVNAVDIPLGDFERLPADVVPASARAQPTNWSTLLLVGSGAVIVAVVVWRVAVRRSTGVSSR